MGCRVTDYTIIIREGNLVCVSRWFWWGNLELENTMGELQE